MMQVPSDVFAPIIGIGTLITFVTVALIALRYARYRIPGRFSPRLDPGRDQMLEDLQARVGELEEMRHRMVELEERLDFAERLLAGPGGASGRLPPARPNTQESRPVTPT